MSNVEKIVQDHKSKSIQLKKAKRKVKQMQNESVSVQKLYRALRATESREINHLNYQSFNYFDDEGYMKAVAQREARIALLKQLIRSTGRNI